MSPPLNVSGNGTPSPYGTSSSYRAVSPYGGAPSSSYFQTTQQQPSPAGAQNFSNPLAEKLQKRKQQAALNLKLVDAVSRGKIEEAEKLLREGADPNGAAKVDIAALRNDEVPPIIVAAHQGNNPLTQLLIDHGAQVNATAPVGAQATFKRALHAAIVRRHPDTVELLLINGADPNGGEHQSVGFPLCVATTLRQMEVMTMLIDAGADVNAKGTSGTTALDVAAWGNDTRAILLLVDHGADWESLRSDRRDAVELALQSRQ
jgi:ankyrin repeat protein